MWSHPLPLHGFWTFNRHVYVHSHVFPVGFYFQPCEEWVGSLEGIEFMLELSNKMLIQWPEIGKLVAWKQKRTKKKIKMQHIRFNESFIH
uniref:Uncharacterized protein n=1 Tax=Rhizophora mucronata TaxID=61149 RepID=A0A2P2NKS3_RHIMU